MADPDEWDDESDQLDASDTLDTRTVADPLDEGISPPERPWIGDGWGVTAREQAEGDSLDRYCCLCGDKFIGMGNNPDPLGGEDPDARCCDTCNWLKVIPARLGRMPR